MKQRGAGTSAEEPDRRQPGHYRVPHKLRHGIDFRLSAQISSRRGRCDSARLIRRIRSFSHDPSYQGLPLLTAYPLLGFRLGNDRRRQILGISPFPHATPGSQGWAGQSQGSGYLHDMPNWGEQQL